MLPSVVARHLISLRSAIFFISTTSRNRSWIKSAQNCSTDRNPSDQSQGVRTEEEASDGFVRLEGLACHRGLYWNLPGGEGGDSFASTVALQSLQSPTHFGSVRCSCPFYFSRLRVLPGYFGKPHLPPAAFVCVIARCFYQCCPIVFEYFASAIHLVGKAPASGI